MFDGDTKRCSRCGETKPITEFNYRRKPKRQPFCKACNSAYLKEHYRKNREYYLLKARRNQIRVRSEVRRRILEHLQNHPCVDCGETDPIVLQFDHVRGTKRLEVSRLIHMGFSWDVVAAEIAKCDVRCANCHVRKTARDRGWFAYLGE